MKIPISEVALIDLDAPVLPAYEVVVDGVKHWVVWCRHCREWHRHGSAEGYRDAHCEDRSSPYWKRGYNLAFAGKWKDVSQAEQG
jgi:hypothetical protein